MKGKKKDINFISEFISNCIDNDIVSSDEILDRALSRISKIDYKIKEIENLKIERCQLLNIVDIFKHTSNDKKKKDMMLLNFLKIKQHHICKMICYSIENELDPININKLCKDINLIFCVKQLIKLKIISRENNILLKGELFSEYLDFLKNEQLTK